MAIHVQKLPWGSPLKHTWTMRDLCIVFERSLSRLHADRRQWEREGFPSPLPWSLSPLRWDAQAVLKWKQRREEANGAREKKPALRVA